MTKMYIGVDPGASGGICGLMQHNEKWNGLGDVLCIVSPYKDIETAKSSIEKCIEYKSHKIIACIENVHAFPTDGRSSAFKFGRNAGQWEGLLTALGVPYYKVTPQKWMAHYGELPKDKTERKNLLKGYAQGVLTETGVDKKATLKTADAILIANYIMQKERQDKWQ